MKKLFSERELQVQSFAGEDQIAKARTHRAVNNKLNNFFARFLENQLFFTITTIDENTNVWVSMVSGTPNFIKVINPSTITIDKTRIISPLEDLLFKNIKHQNTVSLLFIDRETSRRYRLNGKIKQEGTDLVVTIEETYGICPKHIQQRSFEYTSMSTVPIQVTKGSEILQAHKSLIENTNTFFLGTQAYNKKANASHKGGEQGFVQFIKNNTLRIPDYPGNNMFNSLGNLQENQKSGLLFMDYKTNSMLQLTGHGEIQFDQKSELDLIQSGNTGRFWLFKINSWIVTENFNQINWKYLN